jgi:cellulose synthase/poly-beta-1,6-N-acetylglucosamine synthase-like glycosyltransferase
MFTPLFLMACVVYALLDFWLFRGLRQLSKASKAPHPEEPAPGNEPVVTVLIAARNEEHNLSATLNALFAQNWPREKLQIVVVNDRSTDGTAALIADYAERHPEVVQSFTVTETATGISPKKNALLHGLTLARGEWIAMTDADCTMGPSWIRTLAQQFAPDVGMVAGLTTYAEPPEGFSTSGAARAAEFISYSISGAALLSLGLPVIANANNLAYRRQAFEEAGAFTRHGRFTSGDDDFTLQEIDATGKWKVRFCVDPAGQVRTTPPSDWSEFWEQRKRRAGKCMHYRPKQTTFLALVFAFYLAIACLLLAGLFHIGDGDLGLLGLIGLSIKTLADFVVLREGLRLFRQLSLLRGFPLAATIHIPLILAAVTAGSLGRFTWKGQRLGRKA